MNRRLTIIAVTTLAVVALIIVVLTVTSPVHAGGATQIAGVGFSAEPDECTDSEGAGSDFAMRMTGDLEGCHYVFVEEYECSPSGTYRERGIETFVGEYNGQAGTFQTTYLFSAKFEGCSDGVPVGEEIFGRCQHPIVDGSGTGDFAGVSGRIDIKDDVEADPIEFPYKGHLRW